jgi:hypothetical protein
MATSDIESADIINPALSGSENHTPTATRKVRRSREYDSHQKHSDVIRGW